MKTLSHYPSWFGLLCIGILSNSIAPAQQEAAPTLHFGDSSYYTGASPIEVRFPRIMVGPEKIGEVASSAPIAFSPPLEGTFTWRSERSGTFQPAKVPPLSTDYVVTTMDGLTDAGGSRWQLTKVGTVATERARAVQQYPRYFQKSNLPRQLEVFYFFNAEIDLESARKSIRFQDDAGTVVLANVRYLKGSELPDKRTPIGTREQQFNRIRPDVAPDSIIRSALAVTPALPLPEGDQWRVAWNPIVTEGGKLTEDEGGRVLGNVPAFLVTGNNFVQRYDAQDYIEISLNKPLEKDMTAEKLIRWIRVDPLPKKMSVTISASSFRIYGDFEQRTYVVGVAAGLPSADGSLLKQIDSKSHLVKAMPPHLSLPAFGATQYGHGKGTFEIIAANLSSIRLRVKRVAPRDAARALAAYELYTANPDRKGRSKETLDRVPFQIIPGRTVCDKVLKSAVDLDQSDKYLIDWEKTLGGKVDAALLFVSVEGTLKKQVDHEAFPRGGKVVAQSLLQLTDIGLAWKRSREDVLVYAFSQHTGRPLSGVALHRYDADASPLGNARIATDTSGIARVPLKDARWLVARTGKDVQAIRFGADMAKFSMWQFGVPVEWRNLDRQYRETQVFTERLLYKPEETVHLKCLTRLVQGTKIAVPENRNARLKAYDPEGRLFLTRDVVFSERGSFAGTFDLPEKEAGLGSYRVEVSFEDGEKGTGGAVRRRSRAFNHYIYVQEYKANTFAVEMAASDDSIDETTHGFSMSARYLMGKPLAKAKVTWSAKIHDSSFRTEQWPGYSFGDSRSDWVYAGPGYREYEAVANRVRSHSLSGNAELDESGNTTVVVPVAKQKEYPSQRVVTVTASVTDINQQTISTSTDKVVDSSDFYIGLKPEQHVMQVGATNRVDLVTVTPDKTAYSDAVEAAIKVEKLRWNSVKVESAGGGVTTKNFFTLAEVHSHTVTLQPETGGAAAFVPDAPGTYVVTASSSDASGRPVVSAMTITAYGDGDNYWRQRDGIRIDLQADKDEYSPGDEAMILVKSAIHGPALVTVERDSVMRQFVTEITSDAQAIPIVVDDQDTPNVFVSVLLVRGGADSTKKYARPEHRLGYCELRVRNTTDGLDVEVATDASSYRPGTTVTANATVTDVTGSPVPDAEVTLYAVDQGVLDLLPYELPDPFRHFHQPQRLGVTAGSSLAGLLAENPDDRDFGNKGVIIGGGGLMALPKGQMRKNFKACAFWNGELVTDENGRVSATFEAPDNLTEYHLFAVACEGARRFGGNEARIRINKPVMVEPGLPRFGNVGDHVVAKGVVHNTSEHGGEFVVSLELDDTAEHVGAELQPVRTRTVDLAPGRSAVAAFPVAITAVGEAVWRWSVSPSFSSDPAEKDLTDRVETRLPVTWPVPELHESHYGIVNNSDLTGNLLSGVSPELLEGDGSIRLTVSTSPLINAQGAIQQVLRYPYGCLEQSSSSTLPWISLKDLRSALPSLNKTDAEIADAINGGCKRLLSMQTRNGGLGYWPGAEHPTLWGSAYAGMVLALAKESGIALPEDRLEKLCGYLSSQLRDSANETDTWDLSNRCLAAYTLALFGKAEPAYHAILRDKAASLSPSGRAFLALAILQAGGSHAHARSLLERATAEDDQRRYFDPAAAATTIAWCRLAPSTARPAAAVQRLVGKRSVRGDWHNTYLNGWSLLALGEYTRVSSRQHGALAIEATFQGATRKLQLNDESVLSAQTTFQFKRGGSLDKLRLDVAQDVQLYTIVDVSAQPRIVPQEARSSGDFLIKRTYEELHPDGTRLPPTELEIGDLVLVTLEGSVTPRSEYVVIDDALPSILEAINPAFRSRNATVAVPRGSFRWYSNHQEMRTERTLYFRDYIYGGGRFRFSYLARVIAEGTVTAPPAKIEAMYDPGKIGLSDSVVLRSVSAN